MSKRTPKKEIFSLDRLPHWAYALLGLGALVAVFILYSPALDGPFLFDDLSLPFYAPDSAERPLSTWISGVRPLLMSSYWLNLQVSGRDPWAYHATNLLLHALNGVLVFILISRLMRTRSTDSRRNVLCAALASTLFLIHPLQTESVAYIAGRSELLCGLFVLAALAVYSDPKREQLRWRTALVILVLYGLACLSKEQAVVLPAVFLGIDLMVRGRPFRETLRSGARVYLPIATLGVVATVGVLGMLARSSSAGFNVSGIRWYEYLFTQFRVVLHYARLSVLPLGQNLDYDLAASRGLHEHNAGLALALLLVAGLLAWFWRERYPLAVGGLLIFAVLLAPTSSIIPIQDFAAERRMYLPILGLLMVLAEVVSRIRLTPGATAAISGFVLVCAALTHERARLWSSDIAFWSDIVASSPAKSRGYTHLTYAYVKAGQCAEAVQTANRAPASTRNASEFLGVLGHALACERRMTEAVQAFERAVEVEPGVGRYLALASVYRRVGRFWDALWAEQQALQLPPRTPYDFALLNAFRRSSDQTRSRSGRPGS